MTLPASLTLFAVLISTWSVRAPAQRTNEDASIAEALADIRMLAQNGRAVRLLRMDPGGFSAESKQTLADSLVRIAASGDTAEAAFRSSFAAMSALAHSGRILGTGVVFDGAGKALWDIAARDGSVLKGGAVSALTSLADSTERVTRLAAVAELESGIAETAIVLLHSRLGDEGLEVLRELHRRRSVRYGPARSQLETYAEMYGWDPKRPSGSTPRSTR